MSGVLAFRNVRGDNISVRESEDPLRSRAELLCDNAAGVGLASESRPTAHGLYERHIAMRTVDEAILRHLPDAQRVIVMVLGEMQPFPVVLRPPAGRTFNCSKDPEQISFDTPSRDVGPCGVAVGSADLLCSRKDRGYVPDPLFCECGLFTGELRQPLLKRPVVFCLIAAAAGEARILYAVGASPRSREHMLPFEDLISRRAAAVLAGVTIFLQEILPDLVTEERAVLIGGAAYLRLIELLRIEAHRFETAGSEPDQLSEFLHDADHVCRDALLTGREPSIRSPRPEVAAVSESAPSVQRFSAAAVPPAGLSCFQGRSHLPPAMFHLGIQHDLAGGIVRDRDPGVFRSGIDLYPILRDVGQLPYISVLHDDREGIVAPDTGPPGFDQLPGPFLCAEAKGLLSLVECDYHKLLLSEPCQGLVMAPFHPGLLLAWLYMLVGGLRTGLCIGETCLTKTRALRAGEAHAGAMTCITCCAVSLKGLALPAAQPDRITRVHARVIQSPSG